ncbi:MAG: hypothetical protein Q8934_14670 [Bacillota bacterium]|nr:hypothetical protein [Bacillota bacterium]
MNSIFSSIAKRAKKLMIILIILPLLAGLVGYVMEKKAPATYTAKATIELGTWQNEGWTSSQEVANILTNPLNLKKWTTKPDYVKQHLTILSNQTSDLVHVEYTGTTLTEAKDTLTSVITGFMNASDSVYNEKVNTVQNALDRLKKYNTQQFDQPKDMADLQQTLTEYKTRPTQIFEDVSATSGYVSPLKRGIFGLIIGLMLDIIILALPEIFRDFR